MNKTFVEPQQSVISLSSADIICTSATTTTCAHPVPGAGQDELGEMGV